MTTTTLILAINGGALVAAVVAWWRARGRAKDLVVRFAADADKIRLLPNRGTKFRIVYYTDIGAKARDFFATVTTGGADIAEFWHWDVLRDRK